MFPRILLQVLLLCLPTLLESALERVGVCGRLLGKFLVGCRTAASPKGYKTFSQSSRAERYAEGNKSAGLHLEGHVEAQIPGWQK